MAHPFKEKFSRLASHGEKGRLDRSELGMDYG